MRLLLIAFLCIAAICPMSGQKHVPYSSDIGTTSLTDNGGIDPDWTLINNSRRGKSFTWDRQTTDFSTPGTQGGIYHPYDPDYDADCWAVSPMIALTAGTEYTVSFWAKTRSTDFESFRFCVAQEPTSAALLTNVLMNESTFMSPSDFTQKTVTFTPLVSGNYCFGIQCYSPANQYDFYATGFSITGGTGGGGEIVDPSQPQALPFEYTFSDATSFAADWTSLAGPAAVVSSPWRYNSFINCAEFDSAEGVAEDNWLVSPALSFENPGNYMLTFTGTIYGTLNFALGAESDNASSFVQFHSLADMSAFDETFDIPFTVTTPGTYHLGIQANAAAGTMMGYRVNYVKIKEDLAVPARVTDLTAQADANDGLSVNLAWTNPSADQLGTPLQSIEKIEIYRNNDLLVTLTSCTVGASMTYDDAVPTAGRYSYFVRVYNENGWEDAAAQVADAGYVGHPLATMPYAFDIDDDDAACQLFTILDGNGDGDTWKADLYSYQKSFVSKMSDIRDADEYLVSPYLSLTEGYYRLTTCVSARLNSYEVGYVTDRHHPAETFVKCAEYINEQDHGYKIRPVIVSIPQAGEYAVAVHHIGKSTSQAYLDIKLTAISMDAQPALPQHAVELSACEKNNGIVELMWTNPVNDIAGQEMNASTQLGYIISRDEEVIADVTPSAQSLPGMMMTYVDTTAPAGQHTYMVQVYNSFGYAEGEAPVAAVYTGSALSIPYTAAGFGAWQIVNTGSTFYTWETNSETGQLEWEKYYGDPEQDYALTPYLTFAPDKDYTAVFTVQNSGYDDFDLTSVFSKAAVASMMSELEHHTVAAQSSAEVSVALTTRATAANSDGETVRHGIAAGKGVLGLSPASIGQIAISAFSIDEDENVGVHTVVAGTYGIRYSQGVFTFAENARDICISDVSGVTLFSAPMANDGVKVSASGIVIATAQINNKKVVLKVKM